MVFEGGILSSTEAAVQSSNDKHYHLNSIKPRTESSEAAPVHEPPPLLAVRPWRLTPTRGGDQTQASWVGPRSTLCSEAESSDVMSRTHVSARLQAGYRIV